MRSSIARSLSRLCRYETQQLRRARRRRGRRASSVRRPSRPCATTPWWRSRRSATCSLAFGRSSAACSVSSVHGAPPAPPALQRAVEVGDVFLGRIAAGEEELLDRLVAVQEEEGAVGDLAVAAGAARLLVVGVEPGRHLVVEDEARVGLVDAEAEGVGRDHDARAAGHEVVLARLALARAELAVIEHGVDAGVAQRGVHGLGGLHRRGVDEAGAVARRDQRQRALQLVVLVGDLERRGSAGSAGRGRC